MKKFKYIMFTVLLGSLLLFGLSGCGSQGVEDQDTLVGSDSPIVTPPTPDNTPPTITLVGANPLIINQGSPFTDPGATANDNEDGDLTANIIATGSVDTTTSGTYTRTYKVTDSGGLTTTVTRTVEVKPVAINTPPTITLIGDNPLKVIACDPYVELNATADDQEDGDLTSKIVIDNSAVDTNTLGTYEVTYTVQDSDGAKAEVKRTVEVVTTLVNSKVIPQTGQTMSYDEGGNVVASGCSLKDDGFYQAGVARSFVRTEINITAGMVEDTVTGLVWEDTEHASLSSADPSTDPKLLTQIDAKTYCSNLSLGGKTWRLPSVWELTTIANKAEYEPAIENVFKFHSLYAQGYTWSNTDDVLTGNVWVVNFKTGVDVDNISPNGSKYSTRCVSGTEFKPAATYTKDPATNIISSDKTGLEWADDDLTGGGSETWKAAIDFCEALTAGGYSDWRLPNINEYYSIFDYDQNKLVFNVSTTEKMWSSTTAAPGYTGFNTAWVMKQTRGDSTPIDKTLIQPFMCVRNK